MQNTQQSKEPDEEGLLCRLRLVLWSEHQGLVATLLLIAILAASVYFVIQWKASDGLFDIDDVADSKFLFQVDLNAATVGELTLLPGVGPKLGRAILAHRADFGRFENHAELLTVPGIGEKKFQAILPYLAPLDDP